MLLAYVDESFSDDWYYMAALLCDGSGVQSITDDLDRVIEKAVAAFGVPADAELHGYELFQGKGWWSGTPPRARIGVYGQAFTASNASRMIQAIDLITFLYRRMEQHQEPDARAQRANEALAAQIQPLIVHSHCWCP